MFPTDHGESKSVYGNRIIRMIEESGVVFQLTPMGTIIETETMDEALAIVKAAYETLEPDCNRVYSTLKFDIRKGKENRMKGKITSIRKRLEK